MISRVLAQLSEDHMRRIGVCSACCRASSAKAASALGLTLPNSLLK